jgi:predicted nucleic acid-binding protein
VVSKKLCLCLDLNIWCAALLSEKKGRSGTSSQRLVEIVREGKSSLGEVQLIISWGMLNRLSKVLEKDLGVSYDATMMYINTIRGYAKLRVSLTLGGTRVTPIKDTEDAHVLETAIAGLANALVTANFKDFLCNDTQLIIPQRHAIHIAPNHRFHIVHPYLMMDWLHQGQMPELVEN